MERIQNKWLERNARAEARLKRVFDFTNTEPAVVIVDCNYWTFGDLPEEIPDDYYTNPASAFKYQTEKIERHFHQLPEDDYIPFLHPWYGTGVLASAFGVNLVCNPKADPAVDLSKMTAPEERPLLSIQAGAAVTLDSKLCPADGAR